MFFLYFFRPTRYNARGVDVVGALRHGARDAVD